MNLNPMLRPKPSRGFTLIEMAIVLLIAGLLVAGVTQILTSSQKNRGDQAVANEVKTVVSALERFTVDQQATLAGAMTNGSSAALSAITINGVSGTQYLQTNYLPAGLSLTPYTIGIARQDINQTASGNGGRPSFRALILRQPDNTLDDTRLGRIAALIGTQGGLVSNTAVSPFPVNGVMGSWTVSTPQMQYGIAAAAGMIAALTNTVDAQISVNNLSRIGAAGQGTWSEANTMRNDLYMGSGSSSQDGNANDAWAIHNASGVGYVLTDAVVGNPCGTSAATQPATQNVYDTSSNQLSGQTLTVDNYMTVVGPAGNSPQLLQCLPNSGGGGFTWQQVGGTTSRTWNLKDTAADGSGDGARYSSSGVATVTNENNGALGCYSYGGSGANCQAFTYKNTYGHEIFVSVTVDSCRESQWSLVLPDQGFVVAQFGPWAPGYQDGQPAGTLQALIPNNAHYQIVAPLCDESPYFHVYEYR